MTDITLVAIDFLTHDLTKVGLEQTLKHIDAKEVLIISDKEILPGAQHITRTPVDGMSEYNQVMLKGVAEHVTTNHTLFVQWDGMAHNKDMWTDEFLKYDYIGAPWPWEPEGRNVGNGGFSLRSKKLLDACLDDSVQLTADRKFIAEDNVIAIDKRPYLEQKYGINFAPTQLARQFSYELGAYESSFGFHGLWNIFNFLSDEDMDYYMTKLDYTGWNVYKCHHTLASVIRRGRLDIYSEMLKHLTDTCPHLGQVSIWLEQESGIPNTMLNPENQLVIH